MPPCMRLIAEIGRALATYTADAAALHVVEQSRTSAGPYNWAHEYINRGRLSARHCGTPYMSWLSSSRGNAGAPALRTPRLAYRSVAGGSHVLHLGAQRGRVPRQVTPLSKLKSN